MFASDWKGVELGRGGAGVFTSRQEELRGRMDKESILYVRQE